MRVLRWVVGSVVAGTMTLVVLLPETAGAGTSGAVYDMTPFLRQPHPFAVPYAPPPAAIAPARVVPLPPVRAAPVPRAPAAATPYAAPRPGTEAAPMPRSAEPPRVATERPPTPPPPPVNPARPAAEPDYWNLFSEVRGGIFAHDVGFLGRSKEEGIDVNGEILFTSPSFAEILWSPRPHLGFTVNTSGDTSQVYWGLTWEWDFWQQAFFSLSWGGAWHTGEKVTDDPDRKELGCRVLFREGLDLGWRFSGGHSVMAHFSHISNAKLCDQNEGLGTAGIRYGYAF